MRAIDLNLASRPFRNNTLLWVGYLLALVLLTAFTAWNVITWREHIAKLTELQDTVQSIESRIVELDEREARTERGIKNFNIDALEVQASKANEVIEWKAFSWTRLFNRMEQIQPGDIRMTSIRPLFRGAERRSILQAVEDEQRQSVAVAVEGTAKDFDAFWEMQMVLLTDDHFGQVDPERLNKNESREIIFQLSFIYFPDIKEQPDQNAPSAVDDETAQSTEEPAEQQAEAVEDEAAPQQGDEPQVIASGAAEQPATEEQMAEQVIEEQPEEAPRNTRFTKAKRKTKGRRQ